MCTIASTSSGDPPTLSTQATPALSTHSAVLTAEQVRLIQLTWQALQPGEQVGQLFYQRLFEIDPGLRPLFSPDLAAQSRKLVAMLCVVVDGLERLEALLPAVAALGRRHVGYGVQSSHYQSVGQALLGTLRQGLGTSASEPAIAAWAAAYAVLADTMQAAATGHDVAPIEPLAQGDVRPTAPAL